MKKFLFLAFLPLLFFSCSSSDDEENQDTEKVNIIGVWEEKFYWNSNDWHTWGVAPSPIWVFKPDMTYEYYTSLTRYKNGTTESKGTWNVNASQLSTNNVSHSYSISPDKQTLTWDKLAILKRMQ